uniref:Uncharacterized protein n=1 Tax=Brassica oleracea TaxID=3712 RepID=Q2A987_BRAOL|nr:hypothetical protein 40.t00071 [Brassica oleracea]
MRLSAKVVSCGGGGGRGCSGGGGRGCSGGVAEQVGVAGANKEMQRGQSKEVRCGGAKRCSVAEQGGEAALSKKGGETGGGSTAIKGGASAPYEFYKKWIFFTIYNRFWKVWLSLPPSNLKYRVECYSFLTFENFAPRDKTF